MREGFSVICYILDVVCVIILTVVGVNIFIEWLAYLSSIEVPEPERPLIFIPILWTTFRLAAKTKI